MANLISSASPQCCELGIEHLNPGVPRARGGPPTVICYLCGRQFGTKSIAIHEPKCLEKWQRENEKLPKHQRRQPPGKPEIIRDERGKVDNEATSQAAWEASQASMVGCEHCGRRFNPDRLSVHQRSCTADNPAKSVKK